VNHKQVGQRFIATAFVFFLVGGVQSLFMRYQLGSPESTFLDPETYNQLFTMHGTTMMFLFAVPIGEAFGIYFVPLMLGARDMPFPRLNAFGYWAYLFGGIFLYSSFLAGSVPDSGWYAYPPLSGPEYSPRSNLDFWLLGVTFVEVSGVIAAFEIVVLILRFRAPGMAISRMPLFVWSLLVTATMILVAFPPLIMGTVLLELDRKVGTGFYDPAVGGDPMLWQHIFWWFGHPEVYIILLPAIGIVSAILPVFTRTRIVGYTFIAAATVAIGILSFGVWVHHMFTTGINLLGLTFFTAGSLLITIPGGVQIFAFIATLWRGRPVFKPPLLHVIGFLVVFVFGGLSGVMVASVPFDWQAHDTYFVVAHFHYVLIGGVLFPVLAGLTYWRVLAALRGLQPDVPAAARRRAARDAPPGLHLPVRHRLGRLQPPVDRRRVRRGGRHGGVRRRRRAQPVARRPGGGRPVGRQHPRVGDDLASRALQLPRDPDRHDSRPPVGRASPRPRRRTGLAPRTRAPGGLAPRDGVDERARRRATRGPHPPDPLPVAAGTRRGARGVPHRRDGGPHQHRPRRARRPGRLRDRVAVEPPG
jgi:hypothetical protein